MYAVMRFGKSFTSLCCALEMDAKIVLVVSAKADVKDEWKKTVESAGNFYQYVFFDADDLLNNENTSFDDFYSYLIYEPGSTIEDIPTKIFIYLYTGTVVMIQVIDENYCLTEDLRVGTPISKEIIEKYGLYEDDIAEDEGYYESTKYKELVIDIDWGTGRLERYNDRIERIIGYEFNGQGEINLNIRKDEILYISNMILDILKISLSLSSKFFLKY